MRRLLLGFVLLILSTFFLAAQTYEAGMVYFDDHSLVEYRAGNLPIVISAPHGGYAEPDSIPDRDCSGCVYVRDSYTQELAREVEAAILERTGCYPHTVINLLHRKKFDANRDIGDAADGNTTVEEAWYDYHTFLDSAKARVVAEYGRGLFIDLHGHGHTIQRIELGYTISKSNLQLMDAELNAEPFLTETSIRQLVVDNLEGHTHAELLRGEWAFGTLLENDGFPAVPSLQDPFPLPNESYFSGGYNTRRHGSEDGGHIDAIQVECNQDIRFDEDVRMVFADSLASSLIDYIDLHYLENFQEEACGLLISNSPTLVHPENRIALFPNPAREVFHIETFGGTVEIRVCNQLGQPIFRVENPQGSLNISALPSGLYYVEAWEDGKRIAVEHLVVID